MTPRLLLIGVKFDSDHQVPGLGLVSQLPDPVSGWSGKLEGYSIRVVGERLEVWVPAGVQHTTVAQAELAANGIDPGEALQMVSIPLHRCALRFVATALPEEKVATECKAPSSALAAPKPPAPKPVNENAPALAANVIGPQVSAGLTAKAASVVAAKQPTPRAPVAPTPRKPPGARGPSKETGIVRDLSAEEVEKATAGKLSVPLSVERGSGSMEE
jgi:hypothetical protein